MDDRYQYLLLMAGCLLITLPLEFLLRARVYRRPRRLLLALLPMLVVFLAWDALGIVRGHWWYSLEYTTGIRAGAGAARGVRVLPRHPDLRPAHVRGRRHGPGWWLRQGRGRDA